VGAVVARAHTLHSVGAAAAASPSPAVAPAALQNIRAAVLSSEAAVTHRARAGLRAASNSTRGFGSGASKRTVNTVTATTAESAAFSGASTAGPGPGLIAAALAFPKTHPFATNIMVATVKTSCADLIAQCVVERKRLEEVDWKRNMVFVLFGAGYLGGFQWWLQVTMFRRWFPTMDKFANQSFAAKLRDIPGMIDTAKQVGFDVFVHLPFMYLPSFYVVKEFVQGQSWNPMELTYEALRKYYSNFFSDTAKIVAVWLPGDILCFSIPIYLRLPVRHAGSLIWTSYLSFIRGS